MIIMVSGPYSAPTAELRQKNLDAMNAAAARLLELGHTPIIGVNAALPVVEQARVDDPYEAIMQISLACVAPCEAILVIGMSKGVQRELDLFEQNGLPVYHRVEDVGAA